MVAVGAGGEQASVRTHKLTLKLSVKDSLRVNLWVRTEAGMSLIHI
ncbi:hypothetical protein [Streptomyces sp. V2]|nr:hypothetical protein [Streptomyces sp. V2]